MRVRQKSTPFLIAALNELVHEKRSQADFDLVVDDILAATGFERQALAARIVLLRGLFDEKPKDDALASIVFHGDAPLQAPRTAVEGLLPWDGLVFTSDPHSMGKSSVAADLAVAQAAGVKFAGLDVHRTGGTLWFGDRRHGRLLAAHRRPLARPHRVARRAQSANPHRLPIAFSSDVPALSDPGSSFDVYCKRLDAVAKRLRAEWGCDLVTVVFDTMASAARLQKAGDTSQNVTVLRHLKQFVGRFGVLVNVIDHFGKDEERGTRDLSTKEAEADGVLYVKGTTSNDKIVARRMVHKKLRGHGLLSDKTFDIVGSPYDESDRLIGIPRWSVPIAGDDGGRPTPRPKGKITDGMVLALRALKKALDRVPHDDDDEPWVAIDAWRLTYNGMSTTEKKNTRNVAWKRDSEAVVAGGFVECEDDRARLTYRGRFFVD